jgi:hypothetical protein
MNIHFKFPDTLKYLSINQDVPIEQLRLLKQLSLIELKLRLV